MFKWNLRGEYDVEYDIIGFPVFKDYVARFGDINLISIHGEEVLKLSDREQRELASKEIYNQIMKSKSDGVDYEDCIRLIGLSKLAGENIKAGKAYIDGYTWHSHQEKGRFQLIPRGIHSMFPHLGGDMLWGESSMKDEEE